MARRRERQRAEALRAEVRHLRASLAGPAGVREPEAYPLALIPAYSARVVNLPERRRRAFRDHVMRLISQATMRPRATENTDAAPSGPDSPAPTVPLQTVLARACGLCQGNCCKRGGDRAYLTVATMRRFLAANPGLRPRDALAAYLAQLGNRTNKDSCIFHGVDGCALPRELRSDTCNQYFCDELKEFQQNLDSNHPRGFFAAISSGTVRGAAFVDSNG
jgi:hypothetical protein